MYQATCPRISSKGAYNSYKPQKKCVIAKVYIISSLAASPISDYQHPTWSNMREKHPTL
jgi:hypothetical protein